MGQGQSSEGVGLAGKEGKGKRMSMGSSRGDSGKDLKSSLATPGAKESSSRHIHWPEQVATDMTSGRSGKARAKKPRVRTRGEEEEYERQLRQMQGEGSFGSERAAGSDSIILDENEVLTELELQLVEELKKRVIKCKEDPRSPCVKNLNQILMKFPTIKGGFESLKDIFVGVDSDGSGDIDYCEWMTAMQEHGLSVAVPDDQALQIFREADVDKNEKIDFKEFVLVMSFLYLLGHVGVDEATMKDLSASRQERRITLHQKVAKAIDLVVDAFLFFDKNGDGRILKDEVVNGLNTSSGREAQRNFGKSQGLQVSRSQESSTRIWRRRFKEMDCDHSGSISLKEFIFAFEDWVGFDESEEEDDE